MSPVQYLRDSPDPLNPAVLLEDSVAVIGVGVAGTAIALTHAHAQCTCTYTMHVYMHMHTGVAGTAIALTELTGNPAYDACGSIAVGTMMGAVRHPTIRGRVHASMHARDHARVHAHMRWLPCGCMRRVQCDQSLPGPNHYYTCS